MRHLKESCDSLKGTNKARVPKASKSSFGSANTPYREKPVVQKIRALISGKFSNRKME